jgi:hypothetical protein
MRRRHASPPDLVDQEASVVPGGAVDLNDLERRLARYFERPEPRQRAMASRRGCAWQGPARSLNHSSKPPRARWAWIRMRSGAGRAGIRHLTLAVWALALLAVLRAGTLALEA